MRPQRATTALVPRCCAAGLKQQRPRPRMQAGRLLALAPLCGSWLGPQISRSHVVDVKTGVSKMDPIRTSWGGSLE
jgi:hypothetical protein